jgi:hypothetical protein
MSDVLARIAGALAAVVVAGAMAIELHAHDQTARIAKDARAAKLSPAQLREDLADLDDVSKVVPGSAPFMAAAALNNRARRFADASRAAKRATEREPDNFSTWITYGLVRRAVGDERTARDAFARAHELNPLYPTPR